MKPTPAQLAYLRNALAVMDAGRGRGNYFLMGGPGRSRTGAVCKRNRWIYRSPVSGMCFITEAGRAIVEAAA